MSKLKYILITIAISYCHIASANFEFFAEHFEAKQLGAIDNLSGQINDLVLHNGTIYAGYGTHANHSLVTQICGFTPPDNTFICERTIDSEGAAHFRSLNGSLYVAGIDPRAPNQDFYARKSNSNWFNQTAFTGNVAHIYDIESSGGSLWVTLTKFDDDSRVMKGSDGGSWTESLFVTPETGHTTSNYSVLYFIAEYQGALYTQAFDTEDGIRPYSYISLDNGESWNQGPSLLLHVPPNPNSPDGELNYRHKLFANQLVMKQSKFLTSFDGVQAKTLRTSVQNIARSGDYLYVLEEDGDIFRTNNLEDWSFVASAPENSTSIEILGLDIYVGTADSKILRNENALAEPEVSYFLPILYYLMILEENHSTFD